MKELLLRTFVLLFLLFVPNQIFSQPGASSFRVGLANIFFFGALMEDNIEKPMFNNPMETPPARSQEIELDRMTLEYLARYFRYLNADVLVLCEAPADLEKLQNFVQDYLNSEFEIIHNSPVVKNRKYYFEQQIAALVRKDLFLVRRYEALSDEDVSANNFRYPFPGSSSYVYEGKKMPVYWTRFPIEFDLSLKADPNHWYKFIATYPKSKFSKGAEGKRKARIKNFVQQKMLRKRIEEVSEKFEDIFVLGDMNDSPGLDPIESGLEIDSISALFRGDDDPILWDPVDFKEGEGTYIFRGVPEVIDYIFVSHGLHIGKGQVFPKDYEHFHFFQTMIRHHKPTRPDRLEHRELFISDHAPVTVDVIHSISKSTEN